VGPWKERGVRQDSVTYRRKSVQSAAERVLTRTWGQPVRLGEPESVWVQPDECRCTIQRAAVLDGPAEAPATVILKRVNWPDPWDWEDVRPLGGHHGHATPAWRLIGEWAGTQFLDGIAHDPPLGPRFYGGDREEGFVVLEDIGTGERLLNLLHGDDPARAETALLGYAVALGSLHGLTVGREADYDRLWSFLADRSTRNRTIEAGIIQTKNWPQLRPAGESLGIRWPIGVDADVECVVTGVREPGAFLAFTHGDCFPANDMVVGNTVRLYDYETSGFRHALFDGVVKRHLMPWREHCLPEPLARRFEAAYREQLSRSCPPAADDACYGRAAVEMRAAWVLRHTPWLLEMVLNRDMADEETPVDGTPGRLTMRQRTLMVLEGFAEETEQAGHLRSLGAAAYQLAALLQKRWQTCPSDLPLYPAFRPAGTANT
jgi:hypothetical protein